MLNLESFDLSSLFSVEGKTVVVTGGGSGLGKAIAGGFAFNGARVYIVGRRAQVLESAAAEINAVSRGKVIPLAGDVGSKDKVDEVVTALEKFEDHVDVLINCAGVNRAWKEEAAKFDNQHNDPDAVEKLLWQGMDDNEFQSTYSINVNGVYFFSTRMVPLLRKGTAPTVIVIASIAGLMLQRQVISSLVAFHADIEQDSRSVVIPHFQGELSRVDRIAEDQAASLHCASLLASRFTPFKIRVNTILPGIFPSEMTGVSAKPDLSDLIESNPQAARAVARSPAGRAGAETEIVGPCLLLASAAGGYMNNARLTVDGGRLMSAGSNDGVRMEDWTYV